MACNCIQSTTLYRATNRRLFEAQDDDFRCGPVSIINALRYAGYAVGPATRRAICVACNASAKHADDGFKGTKPPALQTAIHKFWPRAAHADGRDACSVLLEDACYSAYILLYATYRGESAHSGYFYHYVFMYKNRGVFRVQNDTGAKEHVVPIECGIFLKEKIYPRTDFRLPMVWALF